MLLISPLTASCLLFVVRMSRVIVGFLYLFCTWGPSSQLCSLYPYLFVRGGVQGRSLSFVSSPIKHTVMTDWPRSKLITDWLTERVAVFCSAVLTPVCQTFQAWETLNAPAPFLSPLLSVSHSRSHEYGFRLLFQCAHTDDEV
ncbi:hypothetical protein ILYODFUR_030120 [Ilyodon furcidens]|uniref:Secreted protein n=1 Tax=Ilyodon furcidens TaxID=33524 RepID=A0ABV0TNA8_9TELE